MRPSFPAMAFCFCPEGTILHDLAVALPLPFHVDRSEWFAVVFFSATASFFLRVTWQEDVREACVFLCTQPKASPLSLAKQAWSGRMDKVMKTMEHNVRLV